MNPLDDHELLLWTMRAGLALDEVRQAQRQDRLQAVRDYLQDQYLACYSDYLENIRGMNVQRAAAARELDIPFQP